MSFRKCIENKVAAGEAKKQKAEQALEHYDRMVRENERAGMGRSQAEEAAQQQATDEIEAGRKADQRRKLKQALNQVELQAIINTATNPAGKKAPWRALETIINRLDAQQEANRSLIHSSISDFLDQFGYKNLGISTRNKAGQKNVVRELFNGGSTGDNTAAMLAKSVKEMQHLVVRLLRNEGLDIGMDPNWRLPQTHDYGKIWNATKAVWVRDHLNAVDWGRMKHFNDGMPILEGEREGVLRSVYDTLVTDGASKIKEPGAGGGKSLGKQLASRRFIQYKDADTWLNMQQKYGRGDVFQQIATYADTVASDIALVQILGANPQATNRYLIDAVLSAAADMDKATGGGRGIVNNSRRADLMIKRVWSPSFEIATHANAMTTENMLARSFSGLRNLNIASLLGATPLLSVPGDTGTGSMVMKLNGMSATKFIARYAKLIDPRSATDRRIARRSGMILENLIGRGMASERFTGEVMTPGWTKAVSDVSVRASGLQYLTEMGRFAISTEFMGNWADNARNAFDQLHPMMRDSMQKYGVTAEDWDLFRATSVFDEEGAYLLRPKDMLERSDIDEATRIATFNKFQRMMMFETKRGILTMPLIVRGFVGLNTRPGTIAGEFNRNLLFLKGWPIAMLYMHILPMMNQAMHQSRPQYLAAYSLALLAAGALSVQLGQGTTGKDPLDMTTKEFWFQAGLKGGGLGIYGDFLFSDLNRYGGGLADTIGGPVWQSLNDARNLTFGNAEQAFNGEDTNITAESLRFMNNWAPGTRLWYLRLIKERMIVNQLEEQVDPKAHQRWRSQARKMARERNQEFFWAPGEAVPRRLPDPDAAIGE